LLSFAASGKSGNMQQADKIAHDLGLTEALFDELPDVVFFVKDRHGRYLVVNQTMANRLAGGDKGRMIGKLPKDVYPAALAASYARQDDLVIRSGRKVNRQLELHIYPGGITGWCLTTKLPMRDTNGTVCGVAGLSRDLSAPGEKSPGMFELASALKHIEEHFTEGLRVEDLAKKAKLSVYQLEQRMKKVMQMSPLQLIHQMRLDEGTRMLRETDLSLGDIALETGWCDQSAFTRHFSRYAGVSPGRYRAMQRGEK
jgi:AraC-like DNA-binding protein